MDLKTSVLEWLANGETGVSSMAIAFKMVRVEQHARITYSHPDDPSDFKRCIKLIRTIPEIRCRLDEMRSVSIEWNALIEHWKEVEDCFMDEVAEWLEEGYSNKRATKTYNLMQQIYSDARMEHKG